MEFWIEPVAPADLVEGLRAAADIDLPGKSVGFAAPVTLPGVGGSGMIDHPCDIKGDCLEPLGRLRGLPRGTFGYSTFSVVHARQKIGNPAGALRGFRIARAACRAGPLPCWTRLLCTPGKCTESGGNPFCADRRRLRNVMGAAGTRDYFTQLL